MKSSEIRILTAHVPAGLAEKVDSLAERLNRSHGWIIEQALAAWVDQEEEHHRRTLAALADVDAGRGIPHEQVKTWVASLGSDKPLPIPECK